MFYHRARLSITQDKEIERSESSASSGLPAQSSKKTAAG
jgi:hypothetical protein